MRISIEFTPFNLRRLDDEYAQQMKEIELQWEVYFPVSVLKPLIARIEKTDWLIDQIVCQVYGLTGEEIRVMKAGDRMSD